MATWIAIPSLLGNDDDGKPLVGIVNRDSIDFISTVSEDTRGTFQVLLGTQGSSVFARFKKETEAVAWRKQLISDMGIVISGVTD